MDIRLLTLFLYLIKLALNQYIIISPNENDKNWQVVVWAGVNFTWNKNRKINWIKILIELLDEHVPSFLNPSAHTQLSSTQTD